MNSARHQELWRDPSFLLGLKLLGLKHAIVEGGTQPTLPSCLCVQLNIPISRLPVIPGLRNSAFIPTSHNRIVIVHLTGTSKRYREAINEIGHGVEGVSSRRQDRKRTQRAWGSAFPAPGRVAATPRLLSSPEVALTDALPF